MLDRRDILENLADPETYPAEMLAYCLKNPDRSAAIFLPILDKAANGTELDALEMRSLFTLVFTSSPSFEHQTHLTASTDLRPDSL
jgi:hypothetical protein